MVWAVLGIAALGATAVLVFGVRGDRALAYALFALMILAHSYMHAGHGRHRSHSQQDTGGPDGQSGGESGERHSSGGCH